MAPENVASLLIFIDYAICSIAINASNKDELFLPFLTAVRKRKKRIRNELYFENIIPRYSVVVKSSHLLRSDSCCKMAANLQKG